MESKYYFYAEPVSKNQFRTFEISFIHAVKVLFLRRTTFAEPVSHFRNLIHSTSQSTIFVENHFRRTIFALLKSHLFMQSKYYFCAEPLLQNQFPTFEISFIQRVKVLISRRTTFAEPVSHFRNLYY